MHEAHRRGARALVAGGIAAASSPAVAAPAENPTLLALDAEFKEASERRFTAVTEKAAAAARFAAIRPPLPKALDTSAMPNGPAKWEQLRWSDAEKDVDGKVVFADEKAGLIQNVVRSWYLADMLFDRYLTMMRLAVTNQGGGDV